MKLFLLLCFFVGGSFAQGFDGNLCSDASDRIDEDCVTCTCEASPAANPPLRKWVCVQTCEVCPDKVVSKVCIINRCDSSFGAYCTAHPDAECVIPDCNNCTFAWRKNGQDVDCQNTGGQDCPAGVERVDCLINPCQFATCPRFPNAHCIPNFCGGCNAEFRDSEGEVVDCTPTVVDRCPEDKPFMNCTYAEVCPSQSCSAQPTARCTVDHCGGCSAVYLNPLGMHVNCTTGDVSVECPFGFGMSSCDENPCEDEECDADPMARCVAIKCGRCHAVFVNDQNEFVNCDTGVASVCPPGMNENPASTEEACRNATCPGNPEAMCVAKQCLSPDKPLECPYEFIGPAGLPVPCKPGQWSSYLDQEKPGTCPDPTMDDDECQDEQDECNEEFGDAGCPRHWKCCHNGCAHVCTPPKEMVDHCPVVPSQAGGRNCREECASDMDCQASEPGSKCCSHGCGTRCKMPVRAKKPGTCPMVSMMMRIQSGLNQCTMNCTSDEDCPGRRKCCYDGCGSSCLNPQEQPGDCPRLGGDFMPLAATQRACTSDGDCGEGRLTKCCAYGCGQICVEPVKVERPGMCPENVVGSRGCTKVCSGDQDCSGDMKCCGNGCSCAAPVPLERPGMCPEPPKNASGICAELCSEDEDCPGQRKCCSNGCGRACAVPIVVKAGMCPVQSPSSIGICLEMCSSDQDCPGNRKCCSNGCGHTCTKPVNMPATCPIIEDGEVGTCGNECRAGPRGRSGCPPGQHCCFNGCGLSCQRPEPLGCGDDGEDEKCDYDPCEYAPTCAAMPNATCVANQCGSCRPKYYMDGEEVKCKGQRTCRPPDDDDDDDEYVTGRQRQKRDGCNNCVCTEQGWNCTNNDCSHLKLTSVVVRFNGTFDSVKNNTDRFTGKFKKVLSTTFGIPPSSIRNIKVRRGSIIVDCQVTSTGTTEEESAFQNFEKQVMEGSFSFDFDGEMLLADSESFVSEDVTPTSKPGSKASKLIAAYTVSGVLAVLATVIGIGM